MVAGKTNVRDMRIGLNLYRRSIKLNASQYLGQQTKHTPGRVFNITPLLAPQLPSPSYLSAQTCVIVIISLSSRRIASILDYVTCINSKYCYSVGSLDWWQAARQPDTHSHSNPPAGCIGAVFCNQPTHVVIIGARASQSSKTYRGVSWSITRARQQSLLLLSSNKIGNKIK